MKNVSHPLISPLLIFISILLLCSSIGYVTRITTFVYFAHRRVKDLFSGEKQQGKDILSFLKMTEEFKMQVCKWIMNVPTNLYQE